MRGGKFSRFWEFLSSHFCAENFERKTTKPLGVYAPKIVFMYDFMLFLSKRKR